MEFYELNRDQCMLVAVRESKGVRRRVVAKLNAADQQVLAIAVPQSLPEALRMAADLAEQNDSLKQLNHDQSLKIDSQEILVNELLIGSGITERFRGATFDRFMARDQQQASALLTCQEYAATFPAKYQAGQCLLMLGNVGTGKTHLASSIVKQVIRDQRAQVVIVAASAIFRAVKTTGQDRSLHRGGRAGRAGRARPAGER